MKRRILSMLLSVLLLLPGCAQAPSGSSQEEGLTVLATTYPVYLFARTVAQGVEGVTVELTANGRHTNYEMKLSGFNLDVNTNKVYGVVLTAADGSEYGLHHVTNIWRGTELGFNTDEPYLASIIGKTVPQITYYTADGVYVLPVNVAL